MSSLWKLQCQALYKSPQAHGGNPPTSVRICHFCPETFSKVPSYRLFVCVCMHIVHSTALFDHVFIASCHRVSHRSSATRCFRTPAHKNYEAYELQFCRIITLDHLHSAHQVLWNSIKDCGFGEPISECLNRMTFWTKVCIFGQQLPKLSTSTDFNETWYAVRVVTKHIA